MIAEDKRPFTDGEFAKICMMAIVETVCPVKGKLFSDVSFSARTITRRIKDMSEDVKSSDKDCFEDLQFFSIAIDESTDITDTAQFGAFLCGINKDFHVVEDFVELVPIKGTATGADIMKTLLQCLEVMNLNFSKLVSITTDGAP